MTVLRALLTAMGFLALYFGVRMMYEECDDSCSVLSHLRKLVLYTVIFWPLLIVGIALELTDKLRGSR